VHPKTALSDMILQKLLCEKKVIAGLAYLTGHPSFVAANIKHACIRKEFRGQERKAGVASTRVVVAIPKILHYRLLGVSVTKRTHGSCDSSHASGLHRKRKSCCTVQ
jgi:hypothetical protein